MKANELKVTDLMVGDWLMSFGAPHKVVGIRTDMFEPHIRTDMSDTWYEEGIENLLEPIPLTPEILEKNGFKTEFYNDYKIYELNNFKVCKNCCDYFEVCDLWDDSDWGWRIINFCPCAYVHQLQHALKLCGIDKEIVV